MNLNIRRVLFALFFALLPSLFYAQSLQSVNPGIMFTGEAFRLSLTGPALTRFAWADSQRVSKVILKRNALSGPGPDLVSVPNSISEFGYKTEVSFAIPDDPAYAGTYDLFLQTPGNVPVDSLLSAVQIFAATEGTLQATVFDDENRNCVLDPGEQGIPNLNMRFANSAYRLNSGPGGILNSSIPALRVLTPEIRQGIKSHYFCFQTGPITLTNPGDTASYSFAIQSVEDCEADISGMSSALLPGQPGFLKLSCQNQGRDSLNGVVKVWLNPALQSWSAPIPWDSVQNDTAFFSLSGLPPFSGKSLDLQFTVPSATPLGQVFDFYAEINPDSTDSFPFNNSTQFKGFATNVLASLETGEFSEPDSLEIFQKTAGKIEYFIRFQNTGNDTVHSISVLDSVSALIPHENIFIMGSSHPYQLSVEAGKIRWDFPQIDLTSSTSDPANSWGWIRYEVLLGAGIRNHNRISNQVTAFFDQQAIATAPELTRIICDQEKTPLIVFPQYPFCQGDSISVEGQGYSFFNGRPILHWSTGDSSVFATVVSDTGLLTLSVADSFQCFPDTTVQFSVQYPTSSPNPQFSTQAVDFFEYRFTSSTFYSTGYQWEIDGNLAGNNVILLKQFPQVDSTYEICLTENICSFSSTFCDSVEIRCADYLSGFPAYTLYENGVLLSNSLPQNTFYQGANFGNGQDTAFANPIQGYFNYIFPDTGEFLVSWFVSSVCGLDTLQDTLSITCDSVPNATFSHSRFLGSFLFQFDLASGFEGNRYIWDWGDGSAPEVSQSHLFVSQFTHDFSVAGPGNYPVTLIVENVCGADTFTQIVPVPCPGPTVADFQFSANPGSQAVTFSDQTTNYPDFWAWDFGDGNTDTLQNPTHQYAGNGTFQVCLTTNGFCGSSTHCDSVTVNCQAPVISFTPNPNYLDVQFSNSTQNPVYDWFWDFGDGTSDTLQNPAHTFPGNGTYQVCLIANNGCGADTLCQSVSVSCFSPVAAFSDSTALYTSWFSDSSQNSPNQWFWDFGDGSTSNLQNPVHTFPGNGTYQVCLIVSTPCGADTICETHTISCPLPQSAFTYSSSLRQVWFDGQSSSGATLWSWDFGDGTTSTIPNPVKNYTQNGSYQVCLITGNTCGRDTICDSILIECPEPVAGFSYSNQGGNYLFLGDSSLNPIKYVWDFGDGTVLGSQNANHTFQNPGVYAVCLTVVDSCGRDTICEDITVQLTGISSSPENRILLYPNPSNGLFTLRSTAQAGGAAKVEVFSSLGVRVYAETQQVKSGEVSMQLDLQKLPGGVYSLSFELNGIREVILVSIVE